MTSQPTAMPGTVHRLGYDSCYDAKDTHAQDFVANEFAVLHPEPHASRNTYVSGLCVLDEQSLAPTYSSLAVPHSQ